MNKTPRPRSLAEKDTTMSNEIVLQPDQETAVKDLTIVSKPLTENPAAVYIASLVSEKSRSTMQSALNKIAAMLNTPERHAPYPGQRKTSVELTFLDCPWQGLRYQHTTALRTKLIEKYAPGTANKMIAALRGVLKECWRLELMGAEDYRRAIDLKAVEGKKLPTGRDIPYAEMSAMMEQVRADKNTVKGTRDLALMALLFGAGLRRAELAALKLTDYAADTGRLLVFGKRRKEREVFIAGKAKAYVDNWLAIRGDGDQDGALFGRIGKGGALTMGITSQAIYNMVTERAIEAGIKPPTPHDFRRTFIGNLLDQGVDTVTVSAIVGHSNPQTTARYDRRGARAKIKAAHMVEMP